VAPVFANFVARSAAVTSITCAGTGIGQSRVAVTELSKACRVNRSLKHLDLSNNGLGSSGAELFCEALAAHPVLEELLLSENHIGNQGSLHVAQLVSTNHSITALGLAFNSIGNEGALAIATGMVQNRFIKTLDLQKNNIGADDNMVAAISDMLSSAETPRTVDSRFNRQDCPGKFVVTGAEKKEIVSATNLSNKFKSRGNRSHAASAGSEKDANSPAPDVVAQRRGRRASTFLPRQGILSELDKDDRMAEEQENVRAMLESLGKMDL